jgi:hypothetical protein
MSFKRFDIEDIVISSDAATAPAWSNNVVSLNTFYTSSDQVARSSGDYYWNIFQTGSDEATAAIQFSIAYGDLDGSGSLNYNSNVVGASPSQVIYKQYRTLINGTEETNLKIAGYQRSTAKTRGRRMSMDLILPNGLIRY